MNSQTSASFTQPNKTIANSILHIKLPLILWLSLSFVMTGCAGQTYRLDNPTASACRFSGEKTGLRFSAEPFIEEDRLIKYFGEDLRSKGLLPVLVVFDNKNAEDGFIIVQGNSKLTMEKISSERLNDNSSGAQSWHETAPQLTFSTSPVRDFAVPILFGYIGAIALELHYASLAIIARNMEEKQLVDKIVYPGGSVNGFLYFKIDKLENGRNIQGISFDVKNVRTNEIRNITVSRK